MYSIIEHTGNGNETRFPLNFTLGELRQEFVNCRVGAEVDSEGNPLYRDLVWDSASPGWVTVLGEPAGNGVLIRFARVVPKDRLMYDFQNGAPLSETSLDEANKQTLMAVHEVLDLPASVIGDVSALVQAAERAADDARGSVQVVVDSAHDAAASADRAEDIALGLGSFVPDFRPADVNTPMALVQQASGGFNWTPTVEAVVATRNITVNIGDLQATIDALPKTLMEWVTITVNPGTYSGEIHISRFQGPGQLTITSGVGTAATTHNVERILIEKCTLSRIDIRGFNATATTGSAFYSSTSSTVTVYTGCSATAGLPGTAGNFGFSTYASGHTIVLNCVASNKSRAVNAERTSVAIEGTTGSGNAVACRANPSGVLLVADNATLTGLTGTTQFYRAGGIIIFSTGDIIGTRVWTSAEYTPVANSATIVTHNIPYLNVSTARVEVWLRCVVANNGWAVGDEIRDFVTVAIPSASEFHAVGKSIELTSTIVSVRVSTGIYIINKTGTSYVGLPMASWRYIFKIWY